jgi:hypothetical protein
MISINTRKSDAILEKGLQIKNRDPKFKKKGNLRIFFLVFTFSLCVRSFHPLVFLSDGEKLIKF